LVLWVLRETETGRKRKSSKPPRRRLVPSVENSLSGKAMKTNQKRESAGKRDKGTHLQRKAPKISAKERKKKGDFKAPHEKRSSEKRNRKRGEM